MQLRYLLTLATSLSAASLAGAAPATTTPISAPGSEKPAAPATKALISQIVMTSADGLELTDTVVFNSDGTATRTTYSHKNNESPGNWTGRIPALQFKKLAALAEAVNFFDFKRIYTSYDWTPSYETQVTRGAEVKVVMTRDGNTFGGGNAPVELWDLKWRYAG